MSTTTTNYGLIKPDTTDPILIGQLNDNSDAIDAALKENADAIENKPDAADIPTPSTAAPAMDGTAAAGTSTNYARADHVHPSDTSRASATSEAEDRTALVEIVDSGAKNTVDIPTTSISMNGFVIPADTPWICKAGTYVLSYDSSASSGGGGTLVVSDDNGEIARYTTTTVAGQRNVITFVVPSNATKIRWYATLTSTYSNIMICTKAAWDISQTYQPHRLSVDDFSTWETYEVFYSSSTTVAAVFDTQASSVIVKINRAMRRVVFYVSLKAIVDYSSTTPLGIITLSQIPRYQEILPLQQTTTILMSDSFTARLTKNNSNAIGAFALYSGTIHTGDEIKWQLEYTY